MAEKSDDADKNGCPDLQTLLVGLKRTVEGLLATHSNNVWSTYGGLARLCSAVENILVHRLKVYHYRGDLGCVPDYWPFIQGLKWLQPTSAPTIDRLNRTAQTTEHLGKGPLWVKESLQAHTLSSQLKILVMNYAHVSQFYHDDAFLCNRDYFQAMYLCLQAVELNKVSLLTEIDLSLITRHKKVCHIRSASLPINQLSSLADMGRRKSSSQDVWALAPPFTSPKSESILGPSVEQVLPYNIESAMDDSMTSAKDALISVLEKSGGSSSSLSNSPLLDTSFSLVEKVNSDPLMNLEILSNSDNLRRLAARKSKPRNMSTGSYYSANGKTSNIGNLRKSLSASEYAEESFSRSPDSGLTATSPDNLLDDILNYEHDSFDQEITNSVRSTLSRNQSSELTVPKGNDSREAVKNGSAQEERNSKVLPKQVKSETSAPINTKTLQRPLSLVNRNSSCVDNPSDQSDSTLAERSSRSSSLPKAGLQSQKWNEHDGQRASFTETTEGYFPRPAQGQSLRSYLSSQDFHTCANIDKENAHFSISEALIAAIEQMKWNHVLTPRSESDHEEGDSDEEIQELKQRIRIRRRERLHEKVKGYRLLSDGRTETTTNSSSSPTSPIESCQGSDASASSEDEIDDREIELTLGDTQSSNLTTLKDSGLSLSMASLYSDADIVRMNTVTTERQSSILESTGSYVSAESVAISLLKKFSDKQLPKASDLEWLVSEQDAPQALLPLPDSYPISPDDGENSDLLRTTKRPRIRGNLEWAPPRAQIIFNIHPYRKRNVILARQNDRCAGCGMKVEPGYVKRFRYCEYLGKYFCQCCHTNSLCYIPGRILQKWDFTRCAVSNFSRDLLTKLFDNPLFNLEDVNPNLYRKVGMLTGVRDLRTQLHHLTNLLRICKSANRLYEDIQRLPSHWTDESQLYSVADLLKVKSGEMQQVLKDHFVRASAHVTTCEFCHGMGFICEFCNNAKDVIFPYQLHKVSVCSSCRACYHKTCFVPEKCPKCARLEARRQRLLMVTPSPEHEQSRQDDDDIESILDESES